jgi:hypothetical protein
MIISLTDSQFSVISSAIKIMLELYKNDPENSIYKRLSKVDEILEHVLEAEAEQK